MSDVPASPQYIRRVARPGTANRTLARSYDSERSCPECGTTLSRYNQGPFCGAHARYNPARFPRLRGQTTEDG